MRPQCTHRVDSLGKNPLGLVAHHITENLTESKHSAVSHPKKSNLVSLGFFLMFPNLHDIANLVDDMRNIEVRVGEVEVHAEQGWAIGLERITYNVSKRRQWRTSTGSCWRCVQHVG